MKIGLYVDPFDPPHFGHLRTAVTALAVTEVNRIYMIPLLGPGYADVYLREDMLRCLFQLVDLSHRIYPIVLGGLEDEEPETQALEFFQSKENEYHWITDRRLFTPRQQALVDGGLRVCWTDQYSLYPSPTMVRMAIGHGMGTRRIFPKKISDVIAENRLYGYDGKKGLH